jgi:hypothetical protein
MKKISKLKIAVIVAVIGISLFSFGFTRKIQETKTITLQHLKLKKKSSKLGPEYFYFSEGSGPSYFEFMLYADPYTTGSGTINGFYDYYTGGVTVYTGFTASGTYSISGGSCTINVTVTNTATQQTYPYSGVAAYGDTPDI